MGSLEDYELLPTDPELEHAIQLGKSHDELRAMVAGGVDVDGTDGGDNTPLWWACNSGDGALAKLLVSLGADVNHRNREGYTPLDRVLASETDLIAFLREYGAKLSSDPQMSRPDQGA